LYFFFCQNVDIAHLVVKTKELDVSVVIREHLTNSHTGKGLVNCGIDSLFLNSHINNIRTAENKVLQPDEKLEDLLYKRFVIQTND
jgi:hypothetical protein